MKTIFSVLLFLLLCSCSQPQQTIKQVNVFKNPNIPPKNCSIWFDGCNKCSVQNQQILACTKLSCFEYRPKKCLNFKNGPSQFELDKQKCKSTNGTWQRKMNGQWVCMNKTSDHNLPCMSSKECQGVCLYYPKKPRGFCSRYTPFVGCAHEFNRGKHFEVCE